MDVFEADLGINGISILASKRRIDTGSRLASLMAGDTKVRVIRYEIAIGIFAAKAYRLATGEGHRRHCVTIREIGFIMAGRALETVADRHSAYTCGECRTGR